MKAQHRKVGQLFPLRDTRDRDSKENQERPIQKGGGTMSTNLKRVLVIGTIILIVSGCTMGYPGSSDPNIPATAQAMANTQVAARKALEDAPTATPTPESTVTAIPAATQIPPSTPTVPTGCSEVHFKTFHVFETPDGPGFGEWDSNLALSRWTNVGVALAWARGKSFQNCQLDFVYDEPTENPFIVIHDGEATYEEVTQVALLIGSAETWWVYRTAENTDVMAKTRAPEGTNVTFLRWQVYKKPITPPALIRAPWE